jgi:hypothetical protein
VTDARDAVALMLFVDEPHLYACSGGLLNTTAKDGTPYFLTANHCLSTDEVAATLESFFQWSVDCGVPCPGQWGTPIGVPSLLGAEVVATVRDGDCTLLRLDADGLVVGQLSGSCGLLAWFPCLSRWHATVDGEDADCSLCLPAGAACSSGAECCSERCRWLLRTCR